MTRQLIFTYSKNRFNDLYNDKEKQKVKFLSLAQVPYKSEIEGYIEQGLNVEIDLTSAVILLNKNDERLYNLEQYIDLILDEDIKFVIEESYIEDALDFFGFIFAGSEKIVSYSSAAENEGELDGKSNLKNKISNLENEGLQDLYNHLKENIIGHEDFKRAFIEKARNFKVFNSIGAHKILSVFLLGPPGIGKTEFAREVHNFFDENTSLVKISFGNYSSRDALNSLIGSPRGFVGSEDGELPLKIRNNSVGVILIDEFEKADKKVFNFFLELLEEGRFTNSQGEEFDLNGYVIIFTSNMSQTTFIEKLPPELISRLDLKAIFSPLGVGNKEAFLRLKLDELVSKLQLNYHLENPDKIKDDVEQIIKVKLSEINDIRAINKMIREEIVKHIPGQEIIFE